MIGRHRQIAAGSPTHAGEGLVAGVEYEPRPGRRPEYGNVCFFIAVIIRRNDQIGRFAKLHRHEARGSAENVPDIIRRPSNGKIGPAVPVIVEQRRPVNWADVRDGNNRSVRHAQRCSARRVRKDQIEGFIRLGHAVVGNRNCKCR